LRALPHKAALDLPIEINAFEMVDIAALVAAHVVLDKDVSVALRAVSRMGHFWRAAAFH
jgi:hypothetical protein